MNPVTVAFAKIVAVFLALALSAVLTFVLWERYGVGTGLTVGLISLAVFQIGIALVFSAGGLGNVTQREEVFEVEDSPGEVDALLKRDGTLNMYSTEYYETHIDND